MIIISILITKWRRWRNIMENKNEELDKILLREMFNTIRYEEEKNNKINKYDDKQMVNRILKYIIKKAGSEKNEV